MSQKRTYRLGRKVLLLSLILIGINSIVSLWYYKKVAPRSLLYRSDLKYEESKATTQVLFMGHSRTQLGINDSLFGNSINFASYGENNVYTYYKLKKVLSDPNNKINTVIVPNGFGTYSSLKNPAICDHTYWSKYIDYVELGSIHEDRERYISQLIQSKLFPYTRSLQVGINRKFKFEGREKSTLHDLETKAEKIEYASKAIKINFINRNCYDLVAYEYLQKTLALCESKGVKIIAIKYPVTSYYFDAYTDLIEQNEWNNLRFDSLVQDEEIEILDFEKLYFDRDDLFKDTHHLNKLGKEEFSLVVKKRLRVLYENL
jgi:hypothetical protein